MRLLIFGLLSLLWTAGFAQNSKILYETKTFPAASVKSVEAATSGGSIVVEGGATGDAVLEVYCQGNNGQSVSLEEAKTIIADFYRFETGLSKGKLYANAKRVKGNGQNSLSISYVIKVPSAVNSDLTTSGGSIRLTNLSGKQDFTTSGGSLYMQNINGSAKGTTSGGSITASDSKGNIELTTSGGSLRLNNLSGTIRATTAGGGITAENIHGDLETETSGGSIRLTGIYGNVNASTSGGSITAVIKSAKDKISLSTSAGSINLTLPKSQGFNASVSGSRVTVKDARVEGDVTSSQITGKINGGGARLSAETAVGSVHIAFE